MLTIKRNWENKSYRPGVLFITLTYLLASFPSFSCLRSSSVLMFVKCPLHSLSIFHNKSFPPS